MLVASFVLLLVINGLQSWTTGAPRAGHDDGSSDSGRFAPAAARFEANAATRDPAWVTWLVLSLS